MEGKRTRLRWTGEELDLLRKNAHRMRVRELAALVGHPLGPVRKKLKELGEARKQRDAEEAEFLKYYYPDTPVETLAKRLGCTGREVEEKARAFGLVRPVAEEKPVEAVKSVEVKPVEVKPFVVKPVVVNPCHYDLRDPSSHCGECAHYAVREYKCRCWHVKGKNGDYKFVHPGDASCRYFMPSSSSISGGGDRDLI